MRWPQFASRLLRVWDKLLLSGCYTCPLYYHSTTGCVIAYLNPATALNKRRQWHNKGPPDKKESLALMKGYDPSPASFVCQLHFRKAKPGVVLSGIAPDRTPLASRLSAISVFSLMINDNCVIFQGAKYVHIFTLQGIHYGSVLAPCHVTLINNTQKKS